MSGRDDREMRFDEELTRAARSLVADELPRGILAPSLGDVRPRRAMPGFAPAAAAVLILLVATALTLNTGSFGGPPPTPTPTATPSPTATPTAAAVDLFRTTAAIRADFERLGYTCRVGQPLSSIEPGPNAAVRESVICLPPDSIGPFLAAVIVEESAAGTVVDLHVKADIVGEDTAVAREAIAKAFAKAAAIGSAIPDAGNELAQWVLDMLPTLKPSKGVTLATRGFGLKLVRASNGGYQLSVQPAVP